MKLRNVACTILHKRQTLLFTLWITTTVNSNNQTGIDHSVTDHTAVWVTPPVTTALGLPLLKTHMSAQINTAYCSMSRFYLEQNMR